jgi:hypothetical protein
MICIAMYYLEAILQRIISTIVFVCVRPNNRSKLLYRSQTTLQHIHYLERSANCVKRSVAVLDKIQSSTIEPRVRIVLSPEDVVLKLKIQTPIGGKVHMLPNRL